MILSREPFTTFTTFTKYETLDDIQLEIDFQNAVMF